jgi:transcriptional antiterminator NusG
MTENVIPPESVAPPAGQAPPEPEPAAPAPNEQPEAPQPAPAEAEAAAPEASTPAEPPPPSNKKWYIVKVQSGREDTIKEAIERKVKIEGLEECFGQIIIPTETVTEVRSGKRVQKEHKLFPGYLMAEVEYNDRILYLFRETSGVGDFVGGTVNRPPPPMPELEVERMLNRQHQQKKTDGAGTREIKIKPRFSIGDRLKVTNGTFAGMEGDVREILEEKGQVKLELPILGRPIAVELEFWQVEPA